MNDEKGIINYPKSIDEIALYGHEAQAKLERISASMAESIVSIQGIDSFIEKYIEDLQYDIDNLDNEQEETNILFSFFGKSRSRKDYQASIDSLDQLKTLLQLEQAQQIKQLHLLKRIEAMAQDCCLSFETLVRSGNAFLQSSNYSEQPDPDSFCQRFQQRMDSLSTSSVIAVQTLGQIKLLYQLSSSLADKLQDAVTHLIPLWRNQVSLLYGVQKIRNDSSVHKRLDLDQTIIRFLKEIQHSNKTISANHLSFADSKEQIKTTSDKKGENDEEQ